MNAIEFCFELKMNNAACVSTCVLCAMEFRPLADLWPFEAETWDPICEDCFATLWPMFACELRELHEKKGAIA